MRRGVLRCGAVGRWAAPRATAMALVLAAAGCVQLEPRRDEGTARIAPAAVFTAVTAPHEGRGGGELADLERFGVAPGALLRKAWLLQANGAWQESLRPLNLAIHGEANRDRSVESLGRWLRARAYERLGDPARAAADLARARELATDPGLVAELARGGAVPPPRLGKLADVRIVPRDQWNASPARPRGLAPLGRIERITVHHSATVARPGNERASVAAVRAIQRHHQQANGWGDIGYHFLIDPSGRIFEGRDLRWQGAHAGDPARNRHNVGVCLLGNYVPREQGRPPETQLDALRRLLASICAEQDLGPTAILTHRELRDTTCPGPYLQQEVERFRAQLGGVATSGR